MVKQLIGKHGKYAGWWRLRDILAIPDEFTNSSRTLRGEQRDPSDPTTPHTGRLPEDYRNAFRYAITFGVDYLIYSYGTPIAWREAGKWFMPDATYSNTTSAHQSLVRTAISQL